MGTKKGQALLIAVLLMTVILLVGAIFVAIVVYVQSQTTRHGQTRQAKALADSGIQYADRMLRTKTADWRPEEPPAWCGGPDGKFDSLDAITGSNYTGDDQFDPGFWGPDGVPGTEDDYYTYEELQRGWCPLRKGNALPADPNRAFYNDPTKLDRAGEAVRRGFTRYPDVRRGTPAGQDLAVAVNKGHVLLMVTYRPNPPFTGASAEDRNGDGVIDYRDADPMSCMIRLESVGVVVDEGFTARRLVAYKPLCLTDYVRFVTDRANSGQPVYLGIPSWVDFDGDGADAAGIAERVLTQFVGPVRANSQLVLIGDQLATGAASLQFDLTTQSGPDGASARGDGYLHRDGLWAASGITYRDRAAAATPTQATVTVRSDPAAVPPPQPIWPSASQASYDQAFTTYGALAGDSNSVLVDGAKDTDTSGFSRFCSPLAAPQLFARDPVTGHTVYEDLTRYTGVLQPVTTPGGAYPGGTYQVHSGEWGHGDAVYIDNASDRQFVDSNGDCSFQTLMDDWLRNLSPTDARAGDSGWNATRTTYAPVGVEIWIAGTDMGGAYDATKNPGGLYVVQDDPRNPGLPPGRLWAPSHVTGEPVIILRRHDRTWRTATGDDSGQMTMVIDHPRRTRPTDPPKQVIYAAGNIRVRGVLPARPAHPTATAPQDAASVFYPDYNLTIVSGGTAYVDGSILSPRDAGLIGPTSADDDRNTKLALLARDCVCLNTTQIVPQDATALVSAAPDDTTHPRPESSHWELSPEAGARLTSSWMFGAQPPANTHVYLAAVMAGKEPGPSALSMSFYQRWLANPVWTPYIFPTTAGTNYNQYLFYFLAPGSAPGANASQAVSPEYQPVPDPSGTPATPWEITTYLARDNTGRPLAGVWNDLAIAWADAGLGAAATNTWVKKWKLMEFLSDNGTPPNLTPQPAVHCRVNAVMYAERGCWFVIPGSGFSTVAEIDRAAGPNDVVNGVADNIDGRIDTADERARGRQYLRYNYDITVNGALTEGFTAPPDAVHEWTDKWSYPGTGPGGSLPSITYNFDSSVRAARDYGMGGAGVVTDVLRSTASANLPRLPLLPVSPDLVYYGETM